MVLLQALMLNKLCGILAVIFDFISFDVCTCFPVLFYGTKTWVISKQAVDDSHLYSLIAPFGPGVIRFITGFIPVGRCETLFNLRWKLFLIKSREGHPLN